MVVAAPGTPHCMKERGMRMQHWCQSGIANCGLVQLSQNGRIYGTFDGNARNESIPTVDFRKDGGCAAEFGAFTS